MSDMLLSVVVTAFNRAELTKHTLKSIFDDLTTDTEVIVVDDGSTDHTARVCLSYPVRYYCLDRPPVYKNPAIAMNYGIKRARGTYVIQVASGTVLDKGCLRTLLEELISSPNAAVVATIWDGTEQRWGGVTERAIFVVGGMSQANWWMYRGYDEEFTKGGWGGEDNDLTHRMRWAAQPIIFSKASAHEWPQERSPQIADGSNRPNVAFLKERVEMLKRGELGIPRNLDGWGNCRCLATFDHTEG